MSEIPNQLELEKLYNEIVRCPSFLSELTEYQKEKLLHYITDIIEKHYETSIYFNNTWKDKNYSEDLSEDQRLNHIVFVNMKPQFEKPLRALNILGWHWTPEKSYQLLKTEEETDLTSEESEKREKRKYTRIQVAFILYFKNITFRNTDNYPESKEKVIKYGFTNKTSARQIYFEYYQHLKNDQTTLKSKVDHFHSKIKQKPNKLKKDIEKILPELTPKEEKTANLYINELENL